MAAVRCVESVDVEQVVTEVGTYLGIPGNLADWMGMVVEPPVAASFRTGDRLDLSQSTSRGQIRYRAHVREFVPTGRLRLEATAADGKVVLQLRWWESSPGRTAIEYQTETELQIGSVPQRLRARVTANLSVGLRASMLRQLEQLKRRLE